MAGVGATPLPPDLQSEGEGVGQGGGKQTGGVKGRGGLGLAPPALEARGAGAGEFS